MTSLGGSGIVVQRFAGWFLVAARGDNMLGTSSRTEMGSHPPTSNPWVGFVLALAAGGIAWGIVEGTYPVFHVPKEFDVAMGDPPEDFVANQQAQNRVARDHAMLYAGLFGGLVALALALNEGIARRSIVSPLIAAPIGAVGGVMGGLVGSLINQDVIAAVGQPELTHTVQYQLALFIPLGIGVGIACSAVGRSWKSRAVAAVGGLIAGALTGTLYPIAVSMLLPTASTDSLVPVESSNRLLWMVLAAGLLGLVVPRFSRPGRPPTAPPGRP